MQNNALQKSAFAIISDNFFDLNLIKVKKVMLTIVIISAILLILYLATAIFTLFFRPRFLFNLMLNYPVQTLIVTKVWFYGSLITLIGCIAIHFISKYW